MIKSAEERRGRPKEIPIEPKPIKFEKRYEDDDCIEVWKYNTNKFSNGPIEVNITYKNGIDKQSIWNKRAKEAKNERRDARQMKKIKASGNDKKPTKRVK